MGETLAANYGAQLAQDMDSGFIYLIAFFIILPLFYVGWYLASWKQKERTSAEYMTRRLDADNSGWRWSSEAAEAPLGLTHGPFSRGKAVVAIEVMRREKDGIDATAFTLLWTAKSRIIQSDVRQRAVSIILPIPVPVIELSPDKTTETEFGFGFVPPGDLHIELATFNAQWWVRTDDDKGAREILTPRVAELLMSPVLAGCYLLFEARRLTVVGPDASAWDLVSEADEIVGILARVARLMPRHLIPETDVEALARFDAFKTASASVEGA